MGSAAQPLGGWLPSAHLASACLAVTLLCSGRGAGRRQASLPNCHPAVLRVCIINRAAWMPSVPWGLLRERRQLLGLAHISPLEAGRILPLLLGLGLELEATCDMSLPIYPVSPRLPALAHSVLSHYLLALLGYHHKQVLFHSAYDRWPHLEFWFWCLLGCVIFCDTELLWA